jgi:hypothetical protein
MFKNALAAIGLLALVVLASSAMFRQFQVPAAPGEPACEAVRAEQLVSYHEDFPAGTGPITRQIVPQVTGNGLVVTSVTVSSQTTWFLDLMENGNLKAGLNGPGGHPDSVHYHHGLAISRGSALSLRARPDTGGGFRVTVTGYVW